MYIYIYEFSYIYIYIYIHMADFCFMERRVLGVEGTMVYRDPLSSVARLLHGKPGNSIP